MVRILVKKGADNEFIYETSVDSQLGDIYKDITTIYNARIKIIDLCYGGFVTLATITLHESYIGISTKQTAFSYNST